METTIAKRLTCYFHTGVHKKDKSKMKKSSSDQILQRKRSLTDIYVLNAQSKSASNGIHFFKDNNVRKLVEAKKQNEVGIPAPFNDFEQENFFDVILQLQGSRLEDQRTAMPPLLLKHQKLKMDIRSPTVSPEEDDPVKQALERGPPYPMVLLPANGEYWMEGDYHVLSRDANRCPIFPTFDMSKCILTENNTVYDYRKSFAGKEHINFAGIDGKYGEILLSIIFNKASKPEEEDHYGVILRLKDKSICEIVKTSMFDNDSPGPRDFIKLLLDDDVDVDRFHPIAFPRASEDIMKFDEHSVNNCYKIGVIYQKFGQVNENEYLQNQDDSNAFREFLDMMGSRIELKDFSKYRGGLDIKDGFTGNHSYFTEYKDKEIMFHVSTLLPYCSKDTQNIGRKRHIGNDVVSIIFQDKNTPFNPSSIRSHFLHVFVVVQVEEANTSLTHYKVSVVAKGGVPKFSPPLPNPSVFRKGPEFREFLLTKIINAEMAAFKSESFLKLSQRTRTMLFQRLVTDIIAKNEKLLLDDFASSSVSYAPLKNSGLLSSFRSAIRNNSRNGSVSSSSSGSLSSTKLSGVSLSLNDLSFIKCSDKKDAMVKKTPSKDKKKVKKDKSVLSSLSQSLTSPVISNQVASEKMNFYAPVLQTNEDRSQDQRTKSPSRFYSNNLFNSIDLNNSLTVPSIPSPRLFQMIDRPPPAGSNSSVEVTTHPFQELVDDSGLIPPLAETEKLKGEIKKLKAENHELLRQNYAEETKKLYERKYSANGDVISSQPQPRRFSQRSPSIPEYV